MATMRRLSLIIIFIAAILKEDEVSGSSDVENPNEEWNHIMDKLEKIAEVHPENEKAVVRNIGTDYFKVTFTSPPESATVHSLRPQDIDVVGALGDSITAGTGIDAQALPGITVQFRGLTWTAGGEESLDTSMTIPNILRRFNPWVKGYSMGNKVDFGYKDADWFNVAVPGARASDMFSQAQTLINLMKSDSRTSIENDWKLISIFIGGNDLCALGRDPRGASPDSYRNDIKSALDLLHAELPRAMVQIIQIMEIYVLAEVPGGFGAPPLCQQVQQIACGHVIDSVQNETTLQVLKETNWQYQNLIEELVNSGRYDTRDDFTVILQPFFKDTILPTTEEGEIDATYFAPDCFHFSSKGHALGALNVWNNMFEPEGSKTTQLTTKDLECPDEDHPYIFTRRNSYVTSQSTTRLPTCPSIPCNSIPGWAVGILCALASLAVLQILGLMLMQSKRQNENTSHWEDMDAL